MPPSGVLGRGAHNPALSNNRGKNGPCGRSDSDCCSGALATCAGVAAAEEGQKSQRQRHRRRQRHMLKAQMTDEEFALDQVKRTGAGAASRMPYLRQALRVRLRLGKAR